MTEDFDAARLATRWLAAEPDDDIRDELQALIDGDPAALTERFAGRLTFGTAGLRAAVGAGPLRMNRLVVRQAAAGLASYLKALRPTAPPSAASSSATTSGARATCSPRTRPG